MAAELGYRTQDGLAMLVGQGAAAWPYWFHRAAPVDVMTQSLTQYFDRILPNSPAPDRQV
jgi:shikimate 5-dehydrogenase